MIPQSTLSHLECTACGARHDADAIHTLCPACNKVLYARYDLERARRTLTRDAFGRCTPQRVLTLRRGWAQAVPNVDDVRDFT